MSATYTRAARFSAEFVATLGISPCRSIRAASEQVRCHDMNQITGGIERHGQSKTQETCSWSGKVFRSDDTSSVSVDPISVIARRDERDDIASRGWARRRTYVLEIAQRGQERLSSNPLSSGDDSFRAVRAPFELLNAGPARGKESGMRLTQETLGKVRAVVLGIVFALVLIAYALHRLHR